MNDSDQGLRIGIEGVRWDPPSYPVDPVWLRWYGMEGTATIRLGNVHEDRLPFVAMVQFVRSLDRAARDCRRDGRSEWEIFDVGCSYAFRRRGDVVSVRYGEACVDTTSEHIFALVASLRADLVRAASEGGDAAMRAVEETSTPDALPLWNAPGEF